MENIDWTKVKVDTPVIIKSAVDPSKCIHRHFAAYTPDRDLVWFFVKGRTSWSAEDVTASEGHVDFVYARDAELAPGIDYQEKLNGTTNA